MFRKGWLERAKGGSPAEPRPSTRFDCCPDGNEALESGRHGNRSVGRPWASRVNIRWLLWLVKAPGRFIMQKSVSWPAFLKHGSGLYRSVSHLLHRCRICEFCPVSWEPLGAAMNKHHWDSMSFRHNRTGWRLPRCSPEERPCRSGRSGQHMTGPYRQGSHGAGVAVS